VPGVLAGGDEGAGGDMRRVCSRIGTEESSSESRSFSESQVIPVKQVSQVSPAVVPFEKHCETQCFHYFLLKNAVKHNVFIDFHFKTL